MPNQRQKQKERLLKRSAKNELLEKKLEQTADANRTTNITSQLTETPKPQPVETPKPQPVETPKPQPVETPKPQPVETPKPQPVETPKKTPRKMITEKDMESINATISKANNLWAVVKKTVKDFPDFVKLEDAKKLDHFRRNYAELMENLPIVCRYMICCGQYSSKALERMLRKILNVEYLPEDKRPQGYMEDQWIQRQADYVQYMFDDYNKGKHREPAERVWAWQKTYELLKGEFNDFRNMHKEIEEKVEEEKKELAGRNIRELAERLATGKQKLNEKDEDYIKESLIKAIVKKLYSKVMAELLETYEQIEPVTQAWGTGDEKEKPKMTMIETVDTENMHRIPDKYKPAELRGDLDILVEEEILEETNVTN